MGGSLGMAAGEAVIKGLQTAAEKATPFIMFAASGGARMQEGILSLMQLPRTTVAVELLREAKQPYLVVLTNPTTGGVTASYAMLGDVQIAEPGALIGFRRPARDRADHPREIAGRLPARRISRRARHGRHGRAPPQIARDAVGPLPRADQVAGRAAGSRRAAAIAGSGERRDAPPARGMTTEHDPHRLHRRPADRAASQAHRSVAWPHRAAARRAGSSGNANCRR